MIFSLIFLINNFVLSDFYAYKVVSKTKGEMILSGEYDRVAGKKLPDGTERIERLETSSKGFNFITTELFDHNGSRFYPLIILEQNKIYSATLLDWNGGMNEYNFQKVKQIAKFENNSLYLASETGEFNKLTAFYKGNMIYKSNSLKDLTNPICFIEGDATMMELLGIYCRLDLIPIPSPKQFFYPNR
jgi:hypothetical protein